MLKDLTWNFFEKTGSIEAFLEYSRLQEMQKGEENDDNVKGFDN